MPAPPIILARPYILVTLSESSVGVTSQKAGHVFGYVEAIYDTCDDVTVGMRVLFDITQTKTLYYGSTQYYLVDEQHKLFKEPIPS